MALPVSGPISFNAINVELNVAGTTQASLNQASYRTLAGVPSGEISLSDFYGKANAFSFTIASNQTNANLRTLAINAGWDGTLKVVATINAGVYISSNSTATPALTVNGSFPNGVELINNGFIVARGGAGGTGGIYTSGSGLAQNTRAGSAGGAGGLALSVSSAITINNIGTIGGGGGGGGGGGAGSGSSDIDQSAISTGSGGGGGRSSQTNSTGGARGTSVVSNESVTLGVAGSAGTAAAAAATTNRPTTATGPGGSTARGGAGGAGGDWGSVGSTGGTSSASGENQANTKTGGAGGAGGGAISGNSNITYIATGTRLGAIT